MAKNVKQAFCLSSLGNQLVFLTESPGVPKLIHRIAPSPGVGEPSLTWVLSSLASQGPRQKGTQLTEPLDSSSVKEIGISSEWLLLAAVKLVFLKVESAFHQSWEVLFQKGFCGQIHLREYSIYSPTRP